MARLQEFWLISDFNNRVDSSCTEQSCQPLSTRKEQNEKIPTEEETVLPKAFCLALMSLFSLAIGETVVFFSFLFVF